MTEAFLTNRASRRRAEFSLKEDTAIASRKRTPESVAAALTARWQKPTPTQKLTLGRLLWQDFLSENVKELLPKETLEEVLGLLLVQETVTGVWQHLPQDVLLEAAKEIHSSRFTLGEVLGPKASLLLKEQRGKAWRPDKQLVEKLMDQPFLRQGLKGLLQKSIQQFIQHLNPITSSIKAPQGVLGTLGKGILNRAEKAARAGINLVEGVGGTLYRQLEEQVQPFLAGFMSRSVKLLLESLTEGEQQAQLAKEARLHVLGVLLESKISQLVPPPDADRLSHQLELASAVATHVVTLPGYQDSVKKLALELLKPFETGTVKEALQSLGLPLEPGDALLTTLGESGYKLLLRNGASAFIRSELEAVWEG